MYALIFLAAVPHPKLSVSDPWDLTLEGQLRPRLVAHSGRDFDSGDPIEQLYVSQRARLGVVLRHETGTVATVRLQDVRFWGEERDPQDGTADGFDMHEAHLRLPLTSELSLTLGRQEIAWDDQRLVGAGNWTQRARAFDGLRLRYLDETLDAELIALPILTSANSHPPLGDADGHVDPTRTKDTWLTGLHVAGEVTEGLSLTGLYLFRRDGTAEEKRHTVGGQVKYGQDGFTSSLEGYYQLGDLGDEAIGAWMGGVRLGYQLDAALKPRLVLLADILSGDGTPTGIFDTLYGTNHGFYGELDFFTNMAAHTAGLGLIDVGGVASIEPSEGITFKAAFHGFQSVEPGPDDDTAFGQEINLNLDWQYNPHLRLASLVGFFLPGDLFQSVRGGEKAEQALYLTADYQF